MRPSENPSLPSRNDHQVLREIAVAVAREAAAYVRARRSEVFGPIGNHASTDPDESVRTKSTPTDPVTVVDTESEQLIRRRLAELRPGDTILGEEGGGNGSEVAGLRWVVDPIDGTVNFLYGIPAFAVSIAVQSDGISVAGAVVDVAAGETYAAARGHGATLTDAAGTSTVLACNPITDASLALLATGFGYGARRRSLQGRLIGAVLPRVRDIRRIGSAALDLCMVASGRVDAHFEHGLSPWDWAAGSLIASEAGAHVRVPAPHISGDAGEVVVAMAPGIAVELEGVFRESGVYDPIPD